MGLLKLHMVVAIAIGLLVSLVPVGGRAGELNSDTLSKEEREHARAEAARQRSVARARALLGYEVLPEQFGANQRFDYFTLSQQAARIGAILRDMAIAARQQTTALPLMPSGPAADGASMVEIYGPGGPTEKSVRALLEYRLIVLGNPRLAVGEITETEQKVIAAIITRKESSVVTRYEIDKASGAWSQAP